MIKKTEIAYIAGFWEGEGSAGFYRRGIRRGKARYRLNVSIVNTNKSILIWIKNKLDYGYICKKKTYNPICKPCYCWQVSDYKAHNFLETIRPFLKFRKAQVDALIDNQPYLHFNRRCEHEKTEEPTLGE